MATAFAPPHAAALLRGQRADARARLNLRGRIVTFNGTIACTLIDMSTTGAKVASTECPRVGSMVLLEGLPMVELFGTVRWRTRGLFGFEFDRPVALATVIALRQHADGEIQRRKEEEITYARNWVQGFN